MKIGVCYYPEHWPVERWQLDASQMREAGISIVRIAEFAWTKMEPSEGKFIWDWLDKAIDILKSENLKIVLSTPTAAPPAWLIQQHPEILPVDENGRRLRFGSRRHYCPNNNTFHKYTQDIVQALAKRYGEHPEVIGWQIDNEFGCYITRCYCKTCISKFRQWAQNKYGTLGNLNQHWGTEFWSQTYDNWEQIEPPNLTVAEPNPSHVLDYYRFASDSWVAYQQLQIDTLRESISDTQSITHNVIADLNTIDYHDLARNLDFISWDSYPTGYTEMGGKDIYASKDNIPHYAHDLGDPLITGFFHTLTRGLKQAPFWIMEQQTGAINWSNYNTGVRSGALRLWTWQAAASGADAVVNFRWRASRFGLEQHHAGLLHHDGSLDNGYEDLVKIKEERSLLEEFVSKPLDSHIGIVFDYSTLWALEMQPHRKGFSYLKHLFVFYRACKSLGIEPDIVSPHADLSNYKILIAPSAFLANKDLAQQFSEFASRGGSVMFGVRSGVKDTNNIFTDQPLPGLFHDLAGATVTKWHALHPEVCYQVQSDYIKIGEEVSFWAEALEPEEDTIVLACYPSGLFKEKAAITKMKHGNGQVFYCGIYPQLNQATAIMRYLIDMQSIPGLDIPKGLTVIQRGDKLLALNFTEEEISFKLDGNTHEIQARDLMIISV